MIKRNTVVNYVIHRNNNPSRVQNVYVDRLTKILNKPVFPERTEEKDSNPVVHINTPKF